MKKRVHQVHGGVLDAAGVDVDRQPVIRALLAPGHVAGVDLLAGFPVRADVGVVIPAGAHEGVHRVGLALGVATLRALHVPEAFVIDQGAFAGRPELGVVGQQNGQVLIGDGDRAALVAVDDRDGRAPHALAADQPVAQAVVDGVLAAAGLLQPGGDGAGGSVHGRAVEGPLVIMTPSVLES